MRKLTPRLCSATRFAATAILLAALFAGCSSNDLDSTQSLFLTIALDKTTYRPGEPIVCQAELLNITDEPMVIRALFSAETPSSSNLHFRCAKKGNQRLTRRSPVTLDNSLIAMPIEIQPWESKRQKFLFVNLTESTGEYELIASYDAPPLDTVASKGIGREVFVPINSRPIEFSVAGQRLFERDSRGLLKREEAIRLALEKYGRPVADAEAVRKQTDTTLLDWWVTLERNPQDVPAGENPRVGFYISPYGGLVRENVPPFPKSPEKLLKEKAQKQNSVPIPMPGLSPVAPPRRPR